LLSNTVIMVAFSSLVLAFSGLAVSLACPMDLVKKEVTERGTQDFVLHPENSVHRRSTPNYNQDYTTGGTVNYSPSGSSFSVTWNTQDDFVVGVGWSTGSTR
jgi:endo-1,4-beta-xylanase